jgi:hypothetical protein
MMNIELNKDHCGKLHLAVSGQYASGAEFSSIQTVNGEHTAIIAIPIKHIQFGSVGNVVPFVRPPG